MWSGALANVTTHVFAALASYPFNPMEGPTFTIISQLGANFSYHWVRIKTVDVAQNDRRRGLQPMSAKIISKLCVAACGSCLANLKHKLGSYRPCSLQWQAAVSSGIRSSSADFLQEPSFYISTTVMWRRGKATCQNPHFLFLRRV